MSTIRSLENVNPSKLLENATIPPARNGIIYTLVRKSKVNITN